MYKADSTPRTETSTLLPRVPYWPASFPYAPIANPARWLIPLVLQGWALTLPATLWGATTIKVNTTAGSSESHCTLADAVATAIADAGDPAVGACARVGTGDPVIELEEETYVADGELPFVIGPTKIVTIQGANDSHVAKIKRSNAAPRTRLFKVEGTLTLDNLTVTGGDASNGGGAIKVYPGGALHLFGCRFLNNASDWSGGAIFSQGTVTIDSCYFKGNSAGSYGGALSIQGGEATIHRSAFAFNDAAWSGGALHVDGGSVPLVENSTFSRNSSNKGGAVAVVLGSASINMCTFKDNTAGVGSTLYVEPNEPQAALDLRRSALARDPAATDLCHGAVVSNGDNAAEGAVGEAHCGFGTLDIVEPDLMLSDQLLDHGGRTKAHVPNSPDSPLLGAYSCDQNLSVFDQRDAFARWHPNPEEFPINRGQDDWCDIGAYESICKSGVSWGTSTFNMYVFVGQTVNSKLKVLNNGGCTVDQIDFGSHTSDCQFQWNTYGEKLIQFKDVWFLDTVCLDQPINTHLDCLADPEGCVRACGFDTPLTQGEAFEDGQFDHMRVGRLDFTLPGVVGNSSYTVDVPACGWGEDAYRYVIQFANGQFDFWDPVIEPPPAKPPANQI
ncbi:MAG: right-handed parallel beta-helix repeat-containing protein [Acidobacteriota bacterium]